MTSIFEEEKFLYRVAKDMLKNGRQDFLDTIVILPNKRSAKFLVNQLTEGCKDAFFLPEIVCIDDLISQLVPSIEKADKLTLLYTLYQSYTKIYYRDNPEMMEDFSQFYFWGDMLLADFDEIDKHLVDAQKIYRNIEDYNNLTARPEEILNEQQQEFLQNFLNIDFSHSKSEVVKNFVKIWNCLYDIYTDFNKSLLDSHLAYSGMLYRLMIDAMCSNPKQLGNKKIKILGFSTLNDAERKLFHILKEYYLTDFYWDIDQYYIKNHSAEAGIFMRENLKSFAMNPDFCKNEFNRIQTQKKEINLVECSYESIALNYIVEWWEKIKDKTQPKNAAIILHNESLIPLVLKSLPADVKKNITMGYPLNQSDIYNKVLEKVLKIKKKDFTAQNIFAAISDIALEVKNTGQDQWRLDILKQICIELQGFSKTLEKIPDQDISGEILSDVITKMLNHMSIDLVSDAMDGIQIMGLLETRALDFEYILMLSTTDDNIPRISVSNGFIPQSFKAAYDMMTMERKAGLFAYYFYRLFHTIKRMDCCYAVAGSDKVYEKSRFLRQIEMELQGRNITINHKTLQATSSHHSPLKQYIYHKEDLFFVGENAKRKLPPSVFNDLLTCELVFYLQDIKYIKEPNNDDNILSMSFGTVFHDAANYLYENESPAAITDPESAVDKALNRALINQFDPVKQVVKYENKESQLAVIEDIHKDILRTYLLQTLAQDKTLNAHSIVGEKDISKTLIINGQTVLLGGRLDRLDILPDGTHRIVDYKSGAREEIKAENLDDFLDKIFGMKEGMEARPSAARNFFEILYYCYIVFNENNGRVNIKPCLQYLNDISNTDIVYNSKYGPIVFDKELNEKFEQRLVVFLEKFLKKPEGQAYKRKKNEENCKYCKLQVLCME